jgi:hypothetical protein
MAATCVRLALRARQRRRVEGIWLPRIRERPQQNPRPTDCRRQRPCARSPCRTWRRNCMAASCRTTGVRSASGSFSPRTPLIIGEHQFPRQVGSVVVDHQDDAFELSCGILEVVRHHQLEEHAAEVLLPDRCSGSAGGPASRPGPAGRWMDDRLGARTLADVEKAQPFGDRRALSRRTPAPPLASVAGPAPVAVAAGSPALPWRRRR